MTTDSTRYTHIAIVFHWLIACVIIAMLAVGKYMVSLDDIDPLRFSLTQWHKSFGLCVLLLSVLRILWRLSHRAPALPAGMRAWERGIAHLSHLLFYFLMLFLPITGWLMVSASPLNISTLLFNSLKVPHLPWVSTSPDKAALAEQFHHLHHYAATAIILLLLLHIAAALKHQFIVRDGLMNRMTPDLADGRFMDGMRLTGGFLIVILAGSWLFSTANTQDLSADRVTLEQNEDSEGDKDSGNGLSQGNEQDSDLWPEAQVTYTLIVMGGELTGSFSDARAILSLDDKSPAKSILNATVSTATGSTGSPQIDDALPGKDWFDIAKFPQATFTSTDFKLENDDRYQVTGNLLIRNVERSITFPIDINELDKTASGGFTINRLDYDIGASEQPDDGHAAFNVVIEFNVKINEANPGE